MRCRRPGCDGAVLGWLDPAYCSWACRMEALHPEIASGERSKNVWLAEQLLPCKGAAAGYCVMVCGAS